MLGTEDEPAKVTSMSPCGMAGWEKAAGTPAGTAWHRAWPRGYQSPRAGGGDGDGGGRVLCRMESLLDPFQMIILTFCCLLRILK